MKKISAICLTVVLCLCCFTACSNGANRFYNSRVLKEFQITDFPKPQGVEDFEATNSMLSFNTTAEGFEDYAEQIYTYLVEKDFKYFGYRGDVISTFFGGAPEYEFYLSSEFSEHQYLVDRNGIEYENCYIFVFSDELSEDNGLLNKCEIKVRYNPDNEEYNSSVLINYTNTLFSYTLINGLEDGFKPSNSAAEAPTLYCAYKSDKTEFPIDDVTLDFYYGGYYYQGIEYELENTHDIPSFELYFQDDCGGKFFIKRVEENFVSEKYSCDIVYDENWYVTEVKFNHSETITIPQEIFTEESGIIYFSVFGTNQREPDPQNKVITGIGFYYKVVGEKVQLSKQPIN